jgi:flavodoxin
MKTLLVYYSRTGFTKQVAEAIKDKLDCDIEELVDQKDRSGAIGWVGAGRDAARKAKTQIDEPRYNPADYDLVIIGTPVWVGICAVAVRTYLERFKDELREVAVFTTQGSKERQRVFDDIKDLLNKNLKAEIYLPTKTVKQKDFQGQLDEFLKNLN